MPVPDAVAQAVVPPALVPRDQPGQAAPGAGRLLRRRGDHRQYHPRRDPPHAGRRGRPAAEPGALSRRVDHRRSVRAARGRLPGRTGRDGGPIGRPVRVRAPWPRRVPRVRGRLDRLDLHLRRGLPRRDGLHGISRAAAPGHGGAPGAGGRGPGAPVRPAALARDPSRRSLAADPERPQGAGLRDPDRRLPAPAGAGPGGGHARGAPRGHGPGHGHRPGAAGGDLHLRRVDRADLLRRGSAEPRPRHSARDGARGPRSSS